MEIFDVYKRWLDNPSLSDDEREELLSIKDDKEEIMDRFYRDLKFGTGGLRGVMAMGTNRMNRFIIKKATQGLANYLLNIKKDNIVAIAYDSRNHSKEFAQESANVLASNGIKVYIYQELMPTPALSYAVRYLKCDAGIVITASHNPKQYNGYKVYGNDGCQCTLEMADAIYQEISKIDVFSDVKTTSFREQLEKENIEYIKEQLIKDYFKSTLKESLYKEKRVLNIVYTPLNGAGLRPITTILKMDGFDKVKVVKEQEQPDGDFVTCPYPNPEIKEALKLGIRDLKNENADILIASDPDSDRLGCVVNDKNGIRILTGNEVGLLLLDALIRDRKNNNPVVVKTIVSTDMVNIIANKYNFEVREVLTGFKFIGEQILWLEQKGEKDRFLFGFEESCGYLTNTEVRDKDAVNAAVLLAEVANHYKLQGKNLVDRLKELYKEFGDYKTNLLTFEYQGMAGQEKIANIMKAFRKEDVQKEIGEIVSCGDYLLGEIITNGEEKDTNLPKSDVLKFFLKDNETVTIRPSGTEPKLKAYIFAYGQERLESLTNKITEIIGKI